MIKEIKIPEIAENVETGVIARVLVSSGDEVSTDQALVEVETDKATTEVPSDVDGIVKEIKVHEGDEITINQVIAILETKNGEKAKETSDKKEEDENEKEDVKNEKNQTDVTKKQESKDYKETEKNDNETNSKQLAVSPLARKIARENEVSLNEVESTGPGNRISRNDVEKFIENKNTNDNSAVSGNEKKARYEKSTNEPMDNINRITAETMQNAWQNIPQVTHFDEADITDLEKFRAQYAEKIENMGGKLTVSSILTKICAFALQKFHRFNASLDWENKEIIYKHEYNIGIAVDTPQGLLVPVIRDVNQKSLPEVSVEMTEVAEKAREKKLTTEQMQNGTFTISNLGGIGGTGFTPIVYPPQVAILGVSRSKYQGIYINGSLEKRMMLPLSLTYDHRAINGADAARFLKYICNVLEDPYALLF